MKKLTLDEFFEQNEHLKWLRDSLETNHYAIIRDTNNSLLRADLIVIRQFLEELIEMKLKIKDQK